MSPTPDSVLDDHHQVVADLRRTNAELLQRLEASSAERDAALAREAAIAEVLQVINSSPDDLQPVLDAILDRALRVCEAAFGFIVTYDGEHFHNVAGRGLPPAFAEILRTPYRPPQGAPAQRLIDGESFVQIADILEEEGTPAHPGPPGAGWRGGPYPSGRGVAQRLCASWLYRDLSPGGAAVL